MVFVSISVVFTIPTIAKAGSAAMGTTLRNGRCGVPAPMDAFVSQATISTIWSEANIHCMGFVKIQRISNYKPMQI